MVLTRRERMLVGLLAALIAALAIFGIMQGLGGLQNSIANQLDVDRRTLVQVRSLDAELSQLERSKRTRGLEGSLIGYMEQLADRAGMKTRVQLNPITQVAAAKVQAIDMKVDQLTLDELVRLLYTIENAEYILVIDQVEISPSFKEKDLLRASLRVMAQR